MVLQTRTLTLLGAAILGIYILSQVLTVGSRSDYAILPQRTWKLARNMDTANDTRNRYVNLAAWYNPGSLADDALWERVSAKGAHLMAAMKESDEEAGRRFEDQRDPPSAASIWQGDLKEELTKWFWHEFEDAADINRGDHNRSWHVESAMQDLKLSGEPGPDNVVFAVYHENKNSTIPIVQQTYNVDGHEYRATGAHYKFTINYAGGVIYAQYVISPMYSAREKWHRTAKPEELPSLQNMSDVLWGYWFRGPNVRNINYFWVQSIANFETQEIIARALREAGRELSVWPGTTFDATSKAGKALIGCENGASFAWFLLQHKAQLGNKWISKVQVFWNDRDNEFEEPHLLFYVEDVPSVNTDSDTHLSSENESESYPQTKSSLSRRGYDPENAADDDLWQKYRGKGDQLLAAMRADDKRAAQIYGLDKVSIQSTWKDEEFMANLEKWGWTSSPVRPLSLCDFAGNTMFDALEIDPRCKEEGGDNFCFKAEHGVGVDARNQMYMVDGKTYRKTSALFAGAVNGKNGLLICRNVRSPYKTGFHPNGKRMSLEELPLLRHMSDIFWGFWALGAHDITKLKYIMVTDVTNLESEKLINRIINNHGGKVKNWPGLTFNVDSEEGKVLIGSPNGLAWGFLLAAHKKQLGRKWISKVTVFTSEEDFGFMDAMIDLLFWVEDVPLDNGHVATESASDTIQKNAQVVAVKSKHDTVTVKTKLYTKAIVSRDFRSNVQADDQLWLQKRCKGAQHVAAMRADDAAAGQIWSLNPPTMKSKWLDSRFLEDLRKWGWMIEYDPPVCDYSGAQRSAYAYSRVLADLRLSDKPKNQGGDMECFAVVHGATYMDELEDLDDNYVVDGKVYSRTFAHYEFALNRKGGVMFAQDLLSPYTSVKSRFDGVTPNLDDLPALRFVADIFWGVWVQSNSNIKNVKYFWVQDAVNSETAKIVNRALARVGFEKLPPWPGHTFSASSMEGQAIIGSPNGYSWAYLLESHKEQLGRKWISKVIVFDAEDVPKNKVDLLFVVEDVNA